ncbi:heme NO-binding domain-containing protein [Nocardioides okcheonensis]|uniref:heme NO-binding domain-containing protein n=1 Tax=Nocardioides okcheonensis TaxID=2894081 RepID=UPI001E39B7C1|nr:heme NO-binding domain-containing protein [Nocardioides okcheonensis]UFN44675.1 heme NO-binding domain-containing protein [Nocardioides okcheonensis]
MKGIIFNLLEGQVEHQAGASAWDGLLDDAGLDGGYSAIGDYPTSELEQLVAAQARRAGTTERDAVRSFGHGSLLTLAEGFPDFFTPHDRTVDFLLTLNDVIHPQVRKLHAAARPPEFDFTVLGDDELRIVYRSHRHLCGMAEGMIAGAATYYGQVARITHEACVLDGASDCVLHCTFGGPDDDPRADA